MKIEWMFDLPTDEKSQDYHYESPILIKDNNLYFISCYPEAVLYVIDTETGTEKFRIECVGQSVISSKCFFAEYRDKIIIYTGELWIYENERLSKFDQVRIDDHINSYILKDHYFIFADRSSLWCLNLDLQNLEWKHHISNTKPYQAGDICLFQNAVACYGNDQLLIIDIVSGVIKDQIKISRIDKLFMPIRLDERTLLIGFTNWSNAGILKYDTTDQKVLWKSKRSFEGPLLRCKIYRQDSLVYWVKNDTELVCLDIDTGEETYCVKTTPWIYTDPLFIKRCLMYGTAGRDGYLVNLDAQSGKEKWSIFLKNGCAYFDFCGETVILGDFEKMIYQVDIASGNVLQKLPVDGEVVGRIKVYQNNIYTVIWGNENTPVRFIKVKI